MDMTIEIDLGHAARELNLPLESVQRTVTLLDEGNTVPFITRFRKDQTGALDEEQVRRIQERVVRLRGLAERKQTILRSVQSQGVLTPELADLIKNAKSLKRLEDLYLPYKPKKQTLATAARQRGLEPLAREVLTADPAVADLQQRAESLIDPGKELGSVDDVLLGVQHLIAEFFSERADVRGRLRKILQRTGKLICSRAESPKTSVLALGEVTTNAAATSTTHAVATAIADTPTPDLPVVVSDSAAGQDAAAASGEQTSLESVTETRAQDVPQVPEVTSENLASLSADGDTVVDPSSNSVPTSAPAESTTSESTTSESETSGSETSESETSESHGPESHVSGGSVGGTSTAAKQEAGTSEPAVTGEAADRPAVIPSVKQSMSARKGAGKSKRSGAGSSMTKKEKKRQRLEAAFKDYYDFQESVARIPPHRVLAINRGERARILRVKIDADMEAMAAEAATLLVPEDHPQREFLQGCVRDALVRLLLPSLERELRREMTEKAETHAVEVFARNLRKLLLQPPVYHHRVLAIDPGFRSGCKLIALDEFGNVLAHEIIHVIGKEEWIRKGRAKLVELVRQHQLSVVAIGNGAACRETEQLVVDVMGSDLKDQDVAFVIVNEAGASVYSTSPLGREELPTYDAVLRSAISIGRRLLDPLSELVKINPANIGVGMYQHDVKAKHLRNSLDAVVESCVNYVGVDVNTASPALLRYVSGMNQLTARRLCEYRASNGPFRDREQLRQVPGFGEATFVQSAGFLKIANGDNPLDATWIHPESYELARKVLETAGCSPADLRTGPVAEPPVAKPAIFGHLDADTQVPEPVPTEPVSSAAVSPESVPPESVPPESVATDVGGRDGAVAEVDASADPKVAEPVVVPAQEGASRESVAVDTDASTARDATVAPDASTGPESTVSGQQEDTVPVEPLAGEQPLDATVHGVASACAETVSSALDGNADAGESTVAETPVAETAAVQAETAREGAPLAAPQRGVEGAGSETTAADEMSETGAEETAKQLQILYDKLHKLDIEKLANEWSVNSILLRDVLDSLARPGRDPREDLPAPVFRRGIVKLEDLEPGMRLSGTVLNVVDFGAFVDIGLTDSGLVHISRLADRFVRDPHEVVGVGDVLAVWVVEIDKQRRRVSLTAIEPGTERPAESRRRSDKPRLRKPQGRRPYAGKKVQEGGGQGKGRPSRDKTFKSRPPRKPKVVTPITKKMKEGTEPLRSFSDLMQFYDKKESDDNQSKS